MPVQAILVYILHRHESSLAGKCAIRVVLKVNKLRHHNTQMLDHIIQIWKSVSNNSHNRNSLARLRFPYITLHVSCQRWRDDATMMQAHSDASLQVLP